MAFVHQNKRAHQQAFTDYMKSLHWHDCWALTLTMKQRVDGQAIDNIIASENIGHFASRLNHAIFGNAAKRFGKGVQIVTVFERGAFERLHCHAAVDRPDCISPAVFKSTVKTCWKKTPWAYDHAIVERASSAEDWLQYLAKTAQKADYADSIDWNNIRPRPLT